MAFFISIAVGRCVGRKSWLAMGFASTVCGPGAGGMNGWHVPEMTGSVVDSLRPVPRQ